MFPKKLVFIALLIIGGIFYFLQGSSINMLQSKDIQKRQKFKEERHARERGEEIKKSAEQQRIEDAKAKGHRFLQGQCVSNRDDGWEFTKILAVGDRVYTIIDCHKYKGCTEQKDISWSDIEFEYRAGTLIPCSR